MVSAVSSSEGTVLPAGAPGEVAAEIGRLPPGPARGVVLGLALFWALFQLWYASPLPFTLGVLVLTEAEARAIHLAFAMGLAFLSFASGRPGWLSWGAALLAAAVTLYLVVFQEGLATRPGRPTPLDLGVGVIGLVLLLEAARRSLGLALPLIALGFLAYGLGGAWMPDLIAHQGASLSRMVSHQWLSSEGVFGVALGVSTSFVFLFVLFGALLEGAGAGSYFIRLAFALMGRFRGGPAKAAVLASGMTGMISGSSIANVVTTGTFTIPLMKRAGFSSERAGAVEVAASVNGQIMPPVMGAAAFLMAEYVGISYLEVIRHAWLPAVISYLALIYIVHLEALKAGLEARERAGRTAPSARRAARMAAQVIAGFSGTLLLAAAVYYGLGWIKGFLAASVGEAALAVMIAGVAGLYLGLLWCSAQAGAGRPTAAAPEMAAAPPPLGTTLVSGLHYLLPVAVLVWCLMVERLSPGLSAFWASLFMMVILITQKPLLAFYGGQRQGKALAAALGEGARAALTALTLGARNMIGIGVATAAAGIIVGVVSLTGIGLVMSELVSFLSGGYVLAMLVLIAVVCVILGLGLPTTANYIVVATLMAPVFLVLAAENGMVVPVIAVHMFVFYFGLMADITPPVGLAAFAAAAVSRGDPLRTGLVAARYSLRTALLPFIFVFNSELLLIGVTGTGDLLLVIFAATAGLLVFVAVTENYFLTRNRLWETAALLLVAFTLLRPGFWMDRFMPPLETRPPAQIVEIAGALPDGEALVFTAAGETIDGELVSRLLRLSLPAGEDGAARLAAAGVVLHMGGEGKDGAVRVDSVAFNSPAREAGLDFDWRIESVFVAADRPAKEWFYLPALFLLAAVAFLQKRRARASG